MAPMARRSRFGPGCLIPMVALALWLPQVARVAGLVALGLKKPGGDHPVDPSLS